MRKKIFCFFLSLCVAFSLLAGANLRVSAEDWTGYTAVRSQSDLAAIANALDGKYYLAQNITITGSWSGIGSSSAPFTGVFDGNGKTITFSNVTVTGTGACTGGLFNYVSGTFSGDTSSAGSWTAGIVKNLTIVTPTVTSSYEYTGSAIGFLHNAYIGGLTVKKGNVSATANFASGIIGGSDGTDLVEKCYDGTYRTAAGVSDGSTVSCSGQHSCSGGIVGMAFGDSYVKECYNYGSVHGTACDGGIVGHLEGSATVRNCINYGTITDAWRSGGIVGAAVYQEMSKYVPNGGGSKGYETIENCANFGTINGSCTNPAGIAAFGDSGNVHISNCYTVNQSGIYLGDGHNFVPLYTSRPSTVEDTYMKDAATSGYSATTSSFSSLVDQLNSNVMNCGINQTISQNITSDQENAGTNQWFFWKIDSNPASPSYGYPVFSNSFTPTSRSGTVNTVTLSTDGGTINSGNVITYITGSEVTLPTDVTKDHYTFGGWYDNAAYSGSAITVISSDDFGSQTFYAKWLQANTHQITGEVTDDVTPSPDPVDNAAVKLMQGQTQFGSTVTTGSDGKFTISNVTDGVYNLVTSKDGIVVTTLIVVSGGDKAVGTITLPNGMQNSVVEVKDNTPPVVVGNLDAQFSHPAGDDSSGITDSDKSVVTGGGSVEIRFTAQQLDAGHASNAGNIEITAQSDDKTIGAFLDFSVYKTVTPLAGNATTTRLTELQNLIEVLIPLDSSLQGKSDYVIYRYHGTEVDAITTTPNADGEYIAVNAEKTQITLYVEKFSTYAIAYNNTPSSSSPGTNANPDTGNRIPVVLYSILGSGSVIAILTIQSDYSKKRRFRVITKK